MRNANKALVPTLPALSSFEIIARHKRFGGGAGFVLPFRALAGRTMQALGIATTIHSKMMHGDIV